MEGNQLETERYIAAPIPVKS